MIQKPHNSKGEAGNWMDKPQFFGMVTMLPLHLSIFDGGGWKNIHLIHNFNNPQTCLKLLDERVFLFHAVFRKRFSGTPKKK